MTGITNGTDRDSGGQWVVDPDGRKVGRLEMTVGAPEADDEHNGGDHEKAEQHAPTCEGHDVSFRVR
jgi:hypothetical protein